LGNAETYFEDIRLEMVCNMPWRFGEKIIPRIIANNSVAVDIAF
jgi:hypothetical protein